MARVTFVHCSDLHLDSPMKGLEAVSPEMAQLCREATFRAFENVVELCLRRRVDFLLVAGDVYDAQDRSVRAQVRFRDGLARLAQAGIPSFVVHGNHDPLDGWSAALRWPEGVHVFGASPESLPLVRDGREVARVYGVSYPTREVRTNLALAFRRNPEERGLAVGLLHANVGEDTGHEPYAPCTVEDLGAAGLDYWALGHVHERRVLREDAPRVVYPGNTQGRNPRERGARGCLVVAWEDGRFEEEFVSTQALRWEDAEVDIGEIGEGDVDAVLEAVAECCERLRADVPVIARVRLRGRGGFHVTLTRPGVLEDLVERARAAAGVFVARIEDATLPAADLEERRRGQDFLGDLLRLGARLGADPGAFASFADEALAPLYASARGRRFLPRLDARAYAEMLPDLLGRAEVACVDLLAGDD